MGGGETEYNETSLESLGVMDVKKRLDDGMSPSASTKTSPRNSLVPVKAYLQSCLQIIRLQCNKIPNRVLKNLIFVHTCD